MGRRVITLTGRPPVTIDTMDWPIVAAARDRVIEGDPRDPGAIHEWHLTVREHSDGRAIIYAKYEYMSRVYSQQSVEHRDGVVLETGHDLSQWIAVVADEIASRRHDGSDADEWPSLAQQCVASLPPEVLV